MDEPKDRQENQIPEIFNENDETKATEPTDSDLNAKIAPETKSARPVEEKEAAAQAESRKGDVPPQTDAPKDADNAAKNAPDSGEDMDIDVGPADLYEQPAYPPRKKSNSMTIAVGLLVVFAIVLLLYFSRQNVDDGPIDSPAAQPQVTEPADPGTAENNEGGGLPPKAEDAVSFTPTPETEAAALNPPKPKPKPKPKAEAKTESKTKTGGETKAADKGAEGGAKAGADKKDAGTDPAKASDKAAAEGETKNNEATKGGEVKSAPDAVAVKDAGPQKDNAQPQADGDSSIAAGNGLDKPIAGEAGAAESEGGASPKPVAAETAGQAGQGNAAAQADSAAAEAKTATAGEEPAAENKPLEIAEMWVVNISSTTDPAESLRLLNRVNVADVGGQVYFYETTIDGKKHHRIRIGFFPTRAEAEAVGRKVKEQFNLSADPWTVRPTTDEVKTFKK